ncbi:hypothetical protein HU200_005892 [Digitaria exilis]|uniref:Cupin type-1 domain-containing protein n=1 Tax=Digitaria exilis TaxID=1010633 RepID=A0A835FTH5_9POAL|nr:hypothetical protein HU200_005892 [Digitaria exilis]
MAAHHLLLLLLAVLLPAAATADSDAVQDYCVPDALLPSYPCRSPASLTAGDFAFAGVRAAGNFSPATGFAGVSVTAAQFPALHTLGMSFARADLSAGGGVNPPHYQPAPPRRRSSSPAASTRGSAMVHFQMNVGDKPATVYGSFNSENPGIVRIPATVFGSGIKDGVLERAFGLSPEELRRLEMTFGPPRTKLSEVEN